MDNRPSYAHALSDFIRVLHHFMWDQGPMNVPISKLKIASNTDPAKKNGCMGNSK